MKSRVAAIKAMRDARPTRPFSRFYYDVETDSKHAAYANLTIIGILWWEGNVETHQYPFSPTTKQRLIELFNNPLIEKIGFNNTNYDDIVMARHGIEVEETNRQDGYLALKTLYPMFPSYSLKFANFVFFNDFHWPEYEYEQYLQSRRLTKFVDDNNLDEVGTRLAIEYNTHDLKQHRNLFEFLRLEVLSPKHIDAYKLDMAMGKPLIQMVLRGGITIDEEKCRNLCTLLHKTKYKLISQVYTLSEGRITNPNSGPQVGRYLNEEGFLLELTDSGEFQVDKETIKELKFKNPVANRIAKCRKVDALLKYYQNYLAALKDLTDFNQPSNWIPTAFGISTARTRRFTSSSKYKLNFQNPSEFAKKVILCPESFVGWAIDATQIENVVHIYESEDTERRAAYEADENFNEYVWLCNQILGGNRSKKELDRITSPVNNNWSIYKQYKTIKLALNFGMGITKFSKMNGIEINKATILFNDIHEACPAIKSLQTKVRKLIIRDGFVKDVFGHIYTGHADQAYKIVAYMVQGTGTGSLPKAQIRANYDTCMLYNLEFGDEVALINSTTHDENSGFISLGIGEKNIQRFLNDLMINMTTKFSHKFDNIPLRAKLYTYTDYLSNKKEVTL